jgi:hypothetical protein
MHTSLDSFHTVTGPSPRLKKNVVTAGLTPELQSEGHHVDRRTGLRGALPRCQVLGSVAANPVLG